MFATGRRPIGPDETSVEVERDLAELGARLCWLDTVEALADGRAVETPQPRDGRDLRGEADEGRERRRVDRAGGRGFTTWSAACSPGRSSRRVSADRRVLDSPDRADERDVESTGRHGTFAADGDDSGSRRRRWQRPAHPRAPAGRATRDDGAGVPGRAGGSRQARRSRRHDCARPRRRLRRRCRVVGSGPAGSAAGAGDGPRRGSHDERDRALAGEIATGTLRWQAAFDHIVGEATGRPFARLDPEVLDILRLTLFQLLHLDRVPASAAVNDAVSLTRQAGKRARRRSSTPCCAGSAASADTLPLPPRPADTADSAGVRDVPLDDAVASGAGWWTDGWPATGSRRPRRGPDSTTHLRRSRCAPTRCRTTREAVDRLPWRGEGVHVEPAASRADALIVLEGNPLLTPLAGDGSFFVQDEASQLVALVRWRPARASGSSTPAPRRAARRRRWRPPWSDDGLIVATDLRGRRVDLLARTVAASGARVDPRAPGGRRAAAALPAGLRRRPARRALLGSRHDPARSRHQVAAARKRTSRRSPHAQLRLLDQAAARAAARRTPRLRDLFERARGERRGRRRVPGGTAGVPRRPSRRSCSEAVRTLLDPSGSAAHACRTATASKRSSPRPW